MRQQGKSLLMLRTSSSTLARSRVWAEPCLLEAAKREYDGVIEEFLGVGEKLFGPYVWGRYSLLFPKAFVPWASLPLPPAVLAGGSGLSRATRCARQV